MIAKKEFNDEKKISRYTFYLTEEETMFSPTAKNNKETLERLFKTAEDFKSEDDPFQPLREKKKATGK